MQAESAPDRAVSPVISVILMVAVTVILSAVIATFVLGIGEEVSDAGPTIGETSGVLETQSGANNGTVRVTHVAGDSVPVDEMEVVVDATDACGETERLTNLPEKQNTSNAGQFDDVNVRSGEITNSIISGGFEADLGVFDSRTSNTFKAGEFFQFRITSGDCQLNAGDEVVVDLVHEPTGTLMITQEFQVQENDA